MFWIISVAENTIQCIRKKMWYWGKKKNTSCHLRHTMEIGCSWHYLGLTEREIAQTPCKARFNTLWAATYPASSVFLPTRSTRNNTHMPGISTQLPPIELTSFCSLVLLTHPSCFLLVYFAMKDIHYVLINSFYAPNRFSRIAWIIWDWCNVRNRAYRGTKGLWKYRYR